MTAQNAAKHPAKIATQRKITPPPRQAPRPGAAVKEGPPPQGLEGWTPRLTAAKLRPGLLTPGLADEQPAKIWPRHPKTTRPGASAPS